MAFFRAANYGEAFQAFTEAIRLCPTSAVYHSNRAAAALKLNKPDIAADDAENALERDPTYLTAAVRAGQAHLQLRQADQAQHHFESVLQLDPTNAAAMKGLKQAQDLCQSNKNEEMANQAHADAGTRPALPRLAVSEEEAALQLYSAEQMLAANPRMEAVKCAVVEGLIACRRYSDAFAQCQGLLPGVERSYLEAEALWRNGEVAAAVTKLEEARARSPSCSKCDELIAFVAPLAAIIDEIDGFIKDCRYLDAMEAATEVLAQIEPGACCGLACCLLNRKANAVADRGHWEDALQDLNEAFALDPGRADTLRLRADVHKRRGAYVDCYLDLQRLKRVAPGFAGLAALIEDAAKLCLDHGNLGDGTPGSAPVISGPAAAFRALGVSRTVAPAEVRKAYLKLAAEWHPDKWAVASEEERQAAEERFKQVQAAYESLMSSSLPSTCS